MAEVIREAILDAAERAFGELGFADAKMTDVAERAGMAAGTLYNYFDSKESIFRALVEQRASEFMGALEAIAAEKRPALAGLARITEATCEYIESHATMFMLFEQVDGHTGPACAGPVGPAPTACASATCNCSGRRWRLPCAPAASDGICPWNS